MRWITVALLLSAIVGLFLVVSGLDGVMKGPEDKGGGPQAAFAPLGTLFNGLMLLALGVVGLIVIAFVYVFAGKGTPKETAKKAAVFSASTMAADRCAACGAKVTPEQARCPSCDIALR